MEIKNTKDKNSEQNIIDEENSSSSSSEEEDNKPNQKESSKDLIKKNSGGNKFAENFEKQRTFFENKMAIFWGLGSKYFLPLLFSFPSKPQCS